jgi:ADP-dependent NAD(P)H-hydrate dehydratase / NAD(P)H-hydrate epimerase
MKALTAAEMREVDRLTIERHGISGLQLMENAGGHVANRIKDFFAHSSCDRPRRVVILCGKGNNGGDGFVVARRLTKESRNIEVRVFLFGKLSELRGDALKNAQRWKKSGGSLATILTTKEWDKARPQMAAAVVVVDALFGTGLRGPVSGLPAQAIEDLNDASGNATLPAPAFILAVDTPTGLPSDGEPASGPVVRAHETITFTSPKIGQLVSRDAICCGELQVKWIGSPASLVEETGKGALRWAGPDEFVSLPLIRASDSHKGNFGHVLVFGGSTGKSGAAVLAGYASLCSGAGLTTVACPDVVQPIIAAAHPEYMTEPLASTSHGSIARSNLASGRLENILPQKTVLAIGPGLGTDSETQDVIRHLVKNVPHPIILDADGLNAFAGKLDALHNRKSEFLCITPHPGEMARLLGISNADVQADRVKAATEAAKRANAHVILKGFHTVLAAPDGQVWVNTTGGPALAKGGSGDVLTGVLAALTAQFGTNDWLRVLALGAYVHGAASQSSAAYADPSGVLSSGVAYSISMARNKLLREIQFGA